VTPEQKIKALSDALARLTHHPRNNPHPCIAGDCAMHPDAAVHHTPARVLGLSPNEGGTPEIGKAARDAIHDAGTLIATSVNAAVKQRHSGWGAYAPAADAAALDLVAAGWTMPGRGAADERLRETILDQQEQTRRLGEHAARAEAAVDAADAFRMRFLSLFWELQNRLGAASEAARVADEPEPTYTGEQVLAWLTRNLDLSDKAADRTKNKSLAGNRPEQADSAQGSQADLFHVREAS
jgi:hypothetical protein